MKLRHGFSQIKKIVKVVTPYCKVVAYFLQHSFKRDIPKTYLQLKQAFGLRQRLLNKSTVVSVRASVKLRHGFSQIWNDLLVTCERSKKSASYLIDVSGSYLVRGFHASPKAYFN